MRASEDKIIGSSLEADVLIQIENSTLVDVSLLKKYEEELRDLFIVSHAYVSAKDGFKSINDYEEDGIKVSVQKAEGEKCQRCWKYRELNADGICPDCLDAVK